MHTNRILPIGILALSAIVTACQGTAIDNSTTSEGKSNSSDADSLISEFTLQESLLTASESYRVSNPTDTSYVTLSTSVQWPVTLGKNKITNLQDSIVYLMFDMKSTKELKNAIAKSVTDLSRYGLQGKIEKIDDIPESDVATKYYSSNALQLIECTEQTVTYSISSGEYMGGAHPNSQARPFTFILGEDRMVTFNYLFKPGSEKELMPKVLDAIAMNFSMSTDDLKKALNASPEEYLNNVYILNGTIAFHFNAYDILPYSYGAFEIYLMPYELDNILTPEACKLLLNQ